MTKTVTISDEMAALLEERRRLEGQPTIDVAAEYFLARGLASDGAPQLPYSIEELRALIDEADTSGPAEVWDPITARAEIRQRSATRTK